MSGPSDADREVVWEIARACIPAIVLRPIRLAWCEMPEMDRDVVVTKLLLLTNSFDRSVPPPLLAQYIENEVREVLVPLLPEDYWEKLMEKLRAKHLRDRT